MALTTSLSLLERVSQGDEQAWECFDRRYRPVITGWCRYWGVPNHCIDDVVQNVMVVLVEKLESFERHRSGSLRAFLRNIARARWIDGLRAQQRQAGRVISSVEMMEGVAALDDLQQRLSREYDLELLDQAIANVRKRFAPQVYEAYRLTELEGMTAIEAETVLRIAADIINVYKGRFRSALRIEVQRLNDAADRT